MKNTERLLELGLRIAVLWCFVLIAFGAFVRLSNAGLGCPDWPTCYGELTWPKQETEVASANLAFPERPVEHDKTWPEQVHRHIAAGLGLLVLTLALLARRIDRKPLWPLAPPIIAIAAAIALYTQGYKGWASASALAGELGLIALGFASRGNVRRLTWLLALICFQALLGKWTVTMLLKPIVVTAHLLFGLFTLAGLLWASLRVRGDSLFAERSARPAIKPLAIQAAMLVLVGQIFLGGWVSTNYAALACPDLPRCHGEWLPDADFKEGFVMFREIGVDYEGGVLDGAARTAVHLAHRVGSIIATIVLLSLAVLAMRRGLAASGATLLLLLVTQIALGMSNVWYSLPLPVAVAHNAVAALLLCALVLMAFHNQRISQTPRML
jgi:heme a synthase